MKFTTSCFVRVRDVEKRRDLIRWCEDEIGRDGGFPVGADWVIGEFVLCLNATYCCDREELISMIDDTTIDCGENIELFKALAAMNYENDMQQLFICDAYADMGCVMWHLCEETKFKHYYVEWEDGETDIRSYFRKATTDEIIEYFKTRGK